jgi:release factor glutamine methyltransferase
VLGWDRAHYLAHDDEPAPDGFAAALDAFVARREAREPMAYIRGRQEFYGRSFMVTPAVLIPRPESEFIIDEALAFLRQAPEATRVADIGTGSGCLAVTIAAEATREGVTVTATDISLEAIAVAGENAARLGVADRVRCVHGSYLEGLDGPFDLIVANPPYVKSGDRPALQPEVRDHEPEVALYGGADGMHHVRGVLAEAVRTLRPGGRLVMEMGAGQDDLVRPIAEATPGLADAHIIDDLQGIPRVLIATRG